MPVKFVNGDLFLSQAMTFAQGVNTKGRMGAGIAVEFKKLSKPMFNEYLKLCRSGELLPGGYHLYKISTPWILNFATQDSLGGAKLEYIEECFKSFAGYYEDEGITSLAMPRIGAGLGGVEWRAIKSVIKDKLESVDIPIYVYENYKHNLKADEKIKL